METLAEPGQFVSAGQIVVRVARAGAREAAVNLPETLRPALGSTAHATLYGASADSVTRYPARLRQLSDAADPLTRTFEARYVLDGAAARAPLGATVTVYLNDSEQAGALAVPLGAIDDEGHGPGVWLIDRKSSSVAYRAVKFVRFDGERAIVSGGIQIGDPIIAVESNEFDRSIRCGENSVDEPHPRAVSLIIDRSKSDGRAPSPCSESFR